MFLTACVTNKSQQKIADSIITEQVKKQIDEHERITEERVKKAVQLPTLPKSCKQRITTKINPEDTNDIAIEKLDIALYEANSLLKNCSNFYINQKIKRDSFTLSYPIPNKPAIPSKKPKKR